MKSRLNSCSHGSACNFIHCFRNPGGDYEWADWDKPPPKYWVKKMATLFGESAYKQDCRNAYNEAKADAERYHSTRSRSRDMDYFVSSSSRRHYEEQDGNRRRHGERLKSSHRKGWNDPSENEFEEGTSDGDWLDKYRGRDRHHHTRRKNSRHQSRMLEFQDRHGDYTHESDSDGHWLDSMKGGDKHHGRTRKSSKHHKKTSGVIDDCDREGKIRSNDMNGNESEKDRDGVNDRHHSHRRRSSSRQNKAPVSPGNVDTRLKIHDSDSMKEDEDRLERHASKRSRHSGEALSSEKVEQKRVKKQHYSNTRDLSSMDKRKGNLPSGGKKSDRCYEKSSSGRHGDGVRSHDIDPIYKGEHQEPKDRSKRRKSKRGSSSGGSHHSDSPAQYDGRSKSHDSLYCSDGDLDERGRWVPSETVSNKQHGSEKNSSGYFDQYAGRADFHDDSSDTY